MISRDNIGQHKQNEQHDEQQQQPRAVQPLFIICSVPNGATTAHAESKKIRDSEVFPYQPVLLSIQKGRRAKLCRSEATSLFLFVNMPRVIETLLGCSPDLWVIWAHSHLHPLANKSQTTSPQRLRTGDNVAVRLRFPIVGP